MASDIRQHWYFEINAMQKWFAQRTNRYLLRIYKIYFTPTTSKNIKVQLTELFFKNTALLLIKMKKNIDEISNNK
jgi:hypothetical protein